MLRQTFESSLPVGLFWMSLDMNMRGVGWNRYERSTERRNKRRHIHLLLLLLPEDFSIIFLLSTFAWESWLWLSFHEIKPYIWCLFQNSDFDTASSCDLGLEKVPGFVQLFCCSVIEEQQICVKPCKEKKKKPLGCRVSLSETLTASPLPDCQSITTHTPRWRLSASNSLHCVVWWSDGANTG